MMEGAKDDDWPHPKDEDDGPQSKDNDGPQPKDDDGPQAKDDADGPKPKNDDVPQPKDDDGPQAKDDDGPQPKDYDGPQPKDDGPQAKDDGPQAKDDDDGPKPKNDDVPQPKDDDGPQPKDYNGPQPKDDDGPQAKDDDDGPKPKDDDVPQPKDDDVPQPKGDDGPQAKDDDDGPKPKNDDVPQPKDDDDVPQPKDDDVPQPKDDDGPQPKDEGNEPQSKVDDVPQPKDEGNEPQSKVIDGPRPKDEGNEPQPKDNDGPQPKDNDGPQPKDNDGPQPKDDDGPQSKVDDGPKHKDEGNEPQPKDNDGPRPKDEGNESQPKDEDHGPQPKDEDHKAICVSTDNEDAEMPIIESNGNDIIVKIQGDGDSCKEPMDSKDEENKGICVHVNKQDDDVPITHSDDSITANDPSSPIMFYRGGDHTIGSKDSDLTDFEPQKCQTVGTDIKNVGVDQSSEKCEALQTTVGSDNQVPEVDINTSEMKPTEEKVNVNPDEDTNDIIPHPSPSEVVLKETESSEVLPTVEQKELGTEVCGDQVSVIGLEASSNETCGEKDQAEDRNEKNMLFKKVEEMSDHSDCGKGSADSGYQDVEPKSEVNSAKDDSSVMNISDTKQGSHFASLAEEADVILPARDAPESPLGSEAKSEKDTEHFESNTVAVQGSSLGSLSDESVEVALRTQVDSKEASNDLTEKCDSKSDMNGCADKVDREMENHETSKKKVDVKNVIEDQLILSEESISGEKQDPQMSKSCGFVKCATEGNGGNVDANAVSTCLNEMICRVTESDADPGLCSEMECHGEVLSERTNESLATEPSSIENLICASSNEMCGSQAFDTSHLESKRDETNFVEGIASNPHSVNETLISKDHLEDEDCSRNNHASQSFDTHLEKELESNVTPEHVADCPGVNEDETEKEEVFQANSNTGNSKTVDEVKMLSPLRSLKVCDTIGSNSPGFIMSSPYTQTTEEYDALGHTSPDSQKTEKSGLREDAEVSQVKMTDELKDENDENSSEDEYGDSSRKQKKRDKAKSPEKGNVFIGYSKRKNKFKCFLCDETGLGTGFEEHVMQHILWKPYKCLYCIRHQYFITRSDIGKHVADAHKGKLPKCGLRAIKKAKEYMEYAKKDGTYQNFNNKLNDMYWSCKHKVATVMSTENVNEPLYPEKSEDVQEESTSNGANIKTSDGADRSEESPVECTPKTSSEMTFNGVDGSEVTVVKESSTVSGVTGSSRSENNQDLQEIGPTGKKEPEVIQPRSLDFVSQLTKPQVSKLIAMYQDNGQTKVEEEQFPTVENTSKEIPVDLIEVPASINVPSTSADLQKKAFPGSQGIPVAIPVHQNEQLPRYVGQNEGAVITEKSKLSSSIQQATPTFIHLLNSPPMGQQQVLPPAQQTGYPQNVKGQLSPPVVSQVLFPALSPLFMNSNQQSPPNVMSLQPTPSDIIQKTFGNTQSVLTIPNVPQVASMNPVSMPLTIPSSTILTLIPSQQFVSSGRKILPAACNSTPAVGQNTSCKLLFVQNVNSMTHLQSVSQQGKPTQEKPSESKSTTTRPHYPNILSKPKKQMNLAPVAEKNSQPTVSSHERILQRQSFSVGLINNDFVCCLCKGKYKHETSFRAHLWNHIHIERKPCSMCISSVNSSGRKTLACAKTEEYIEKLKNNKIGNASHVDVVVPSLDKTLTGVQRQELLPQALFDKCQSILAAKNEQVTAAAMTIKQDKCSRNAETEKPATEKETLLVNTAGGLLSAISNLSASEKVTKLSSLNNGAAGILTNESGSKGTSGALCRDPSPVSNDHPVPVSAPSVSTSAVRNDNNQSILNKSSLVNRVGRASFALATQKPFHVNRDANASVSKESTSVMRSTPASVCSDLSSVNSNIAASVSREFPVVKGNSAESVFRGPSPVSRDVSESVSGKPSSMNTRSTKWQFFVCGSGCGYSSLYGNELKKHVGECHFPNSMSCVHCLYYADGPDNLIRHMGKHYLAHAPGTAVHSCSVSGCKFTTNILQGFYQHMVGSHPDIVNFECSNCRKTFPEVKSLMEHLQNNLLHVVNCRHCSAKDLVKAVIMSHISVTHPEKGRMASMVKQLLCKDRKENQFILEQMQKSVPITLSASEANKPELVSMDKPLPRNTYDMDDVDSSFELEIDRAASPIAEGDAKSTGFVESVTCPLSVDPVYDCCVCSYVGENQKDLNTHMSKHAENPALKTLAFSCPECPEEFNLLNNFEMHLRKHSNILTYDICSCLICNMKTGSREDVEKHIRAMHEMVIGGGREFVDFKLKVSNSHVVKCNLCSYRCLGKESMERHNGKHHAKGVSQTIRTSCDERNSPYAPPLETNDSRKNESTAEKPKASSEVRVKMHIPSNSVFLNAVRCVKCNFSSVYKGNIQRHIKQFHPDVELVVDQGKLTPVKVGIQSSLEVEPNDDSLKIGGRLLDTELEWLYENHGKSYKCMLCSKDMFFQRKNYLHSHILDHFGISLWKCALCDFKTSRRIVAVDHVKDMHHEQCDTDVIIPLVDEISTEVGHVLGKLVQGDMPVENIRPTLGSKELDDELRNKYKVIGKKKICKTCDVEHQSCYAIHSHIMRRHLKLFLFKCSYCNFSAVDRYSVAKHSTASHPHKEIVVKYEPASNKTQKKDKPLGKRHPSSHLEHSSRETRASTEKSATAMSDSIHCFSGKQLHPHESETRNELRVGSDHLDQKLRPLYDVKQGREKLLICKTCEAAHFSKYTLHCDLLQHLKVKLVACPYCTFESIENKQLTEHINVAHPNQRVYFLFLEVNIEDAAKKYVNKLEPRACKKTVQKQVSPKIQKPSLSQLLGGRKNKSPSKQHLKSPEKLSKNVVSVMAGGLKKFRCRLCDYMALTKNSVGTHVFKVHENSGKGKTNTFTHITHVSDKLTCKFCEFKSSRSGELRIHYKEKHPQEVSDDSDEKRMEDAGAYTKSQKSEEKGGHKSEAKSHLQNGTVKPPAKPPAKHQTDNQMKEKDVSNPAKKPEVILDRADSDEVVRDISESVKLKKRKEDRAEVTKDEHPAKKFKTNVTYHCPKCDFKDGKKENGVIHLKTEHGVTKLMQCAYCTASYVYEGKLKNHIKFLHKGKDMKFNMLPLESMLTESTKEKKSTSELCAGNSSSMCPASDCHKDSEKEQKSSHSLQSAKVDDRSKQTSLEPSKSSENSVTYKKNHSTNKANHTKSFSEHSPGSSKRSGQGATVVHSHSRSASTDSSAQNTSRNLSKTAKKVPNRSPEGSEVKTTPKPPLKDSKKIPGKDTKSSSVSPKYKSAFAKEGDETFMNCSKHSNSNQSKPSKSNQKNLAKDSLGEPQCSRGTDKSLGLPSYVPSSPDNSDDEKGDYYKYICVYCDFKINKRSEMKIHLANHSIERLYKGIFPETEEAKIKIRNKVRDIMPICEERAKNKQEKIKEVISAEGATLISKEVKPKEEKLSPKKRTSEAVRKEQDCRQDTDSDSDAGSEIQRPKKVRRIKRVLSSSEDEDADVKSQLPKQQLTSPSGGQLTYCCHLCAYKGKLLYKFRSHLASHGTFKYLNADMSNESVLRCGFCDFLAADKDDFSQHVEKHLDGRIFKCGYCKYDSYHSKNMRSHLKNKHRHKPEKMIDLRSVLKERAQRPSQRPQLVNLDPELCLVNALKNREYRKLLDEAHCKTLDMPLYMVNIINKINEKKIVDVYPDTSDDDYGADYSDDDYSVNDDDEEEGEDDVIFIQ